MMDYYEMRRKIVEFLNSSGLNAYDLCRIGKDLCCCRTCRHFVQHYAKDGQPVAFGHCVKSNIPRAKQPNTQSCGYWDLE